MKIGVILIFRLPKNTDQKIMSRFTEDVYGRNTSSHKMKYRYRRYGILEGIPHRKFIRGVVLVSKENASKLEKILKEYNAICYKRYVILTKDDEAELEKENEEGKKI